MKISKVKALVLVGVFSGAVGTAVYATPAVPAETVAAAKPAEASKKGAGLYKKSDKVQPRQKKIVPMRKKKFGPGN